MNENHNIKVRFVPGLTNRLEFGQMFGGFLTQYGDKNILVDCGTVTGARNLVRGLLDRLGEKPLDYVFLTHIHVDHSGGLAEIFRTWPDCQAVVQAQAMNHLINPEKLWLGTVKVMGELAPMYGQPQSLEPGRLIPHTEFSLPGLTIIETPGHAAHHLSYLLKDIIFAGEAAGCPYHLNNRLYSRPATPPRYYPEPTFASLALLEKQPAEWGYFGHTQEECRLSETASNCREQLKFWDEFLFSRWQEEASKTDEQELIVSLTDRLFEEDPHLRPILSLGPLKTKVEKYFMQNSVAGFLGFYAERERKVSRK
ncbi:MAG: MBL fold metallo-hydrolase [Deltaproteobacteria bacterium]|jgi:glyoxylase-like metal-dependent hydrolase (beta-lactamase superfamily II)|nr:MBL fold metallo-hydrolase [Deltaproteobacteria bacterium]